MFRNVLKMKVICQKEVIDALQGYIEGLLDLA